MIQQKESQIIIWETTLTSASDFDRNININAQMLDSECSGGFSICLRKINTAKISAPVTPCRLLRYHKDNPDAWVPEAPHALSLHWSRKIPFGPSFPESSASQNFLPVSSCCRDAGQEEEKGGEKEGKKVKMVIQI